MRRIVEAIIRGMERKGVIAGEDREIYAYGLDAALYTLISTAGLLILGALLGRFAETLFIVALFYINQTLGGGFHAKSHKSCFLTMTVGLLVCLLSLALPYRPAVCGTVGVGSLLLLFGIPLTLHPNKAYLYSQRDRLAKRSRIAVAIQAALLMGMLCWGKPVYTQTVCAAFLACAVSRLVAARNAAAPPERKE